MPKKLKVFLLQLVYLLPCLADAQSGTKINRGEVVKRHTVHISKTDPLSSLSAGNGGFAFTVDITGLQSFPEYYAAGVPLGTQSEWGWHRFPNTEQFRFEETMRTYELEGRKIPYPVQLKEPMRSKQAVEYFRMNPHRLQLGSIGLEIQKKDGTLAGIEDIQHIDQELDLWTGTIKSRFVVDDEPVEVITYVHQQMDLVAARIVSPLVEKHKLSVRIRFPYPNGQFKDEGINYAPIQNHHTEQVKRHSGYALIKRQLDSTRYYVHAAWQQTASVERKGEHYFLLRPSGAGSEFDVSILFSEEETVSSLPSFSQTEKNNKKEWPSFWKSGAAVDFSGSTDPRAFELERRVVLSQYLLRIQEASGFPPQETGLTFNSWYGRPHLEMLWWHAVHYALWGRTEWMQKCLDWYSTVADPAAAIAKRQGFQGVRWQKMTDHQGGEAPSSVGSFLIWQQPHFIYMAELLYREKTSKRILNKYKELLFATADFMADYPSFDKNTGKYNLGRGLMPAQERFDPLTTFNPAYELAYWSWALETAQQWRIRLGMSRNKKWDEVLSKLAPLPVKDGVYLAAASAPDSYSNDQYKTDHPAVLAAYATLPAVHGLDTTIMKNTFDLVWKQWHWEETWGWDFPLAAMAATRLKMPGRAIDALFMPVQKNTYLVNGHNFQDERLTIYLPGNGALLSAVAMMCAGYTNCKESNPGFPKNGAWVVKWEGLEPLF